MTPVLKISGLNRTLPALAGIACGLALWRALPGGNAVAMSLTLVPFALALLAGIAKSGSA